MFTTCESQQLSTAATVPKSGCSLQSLARSPRDQNQQKSNDNNIYLCPMSWAQRLRCICESIPQYASDTRTTAMSTNICAGKVWRSPHRRLPLSPLVGCCASLAKNQPTCAQLRPTCSSIELHRKLYCDKIMKTNRQKNNDTNNQCYCLVCNNPHHTAPPSLFSS